MKNSDYDFTASLSNYFEDFIPTFNNFMSKCPVHKEVALYVDIGQVFIRILDSTNNVIDTLQFNINPTQNKKDTIKKIKESLIKYYPILWEQVTTSLEAKEVESLISSGISLEDALKTKKSLYNKKYTIIRVHHKYNEIDCLTEDNEVLKIKLYYPLELFMNNVWGSERCIINDFKSKMKILYNLKYKES